MNNFKRISEKLKLPKLKKVKKKKKEPPRDNIPKQEIKNLIDDSSIGLGY